MAKATRGSSSIKLLHTLLIIAFCRLFLGAWAATCMESGNNTIVVEETDDVAMLNDAVNCSDGGQVDALWVGSVELSTTISIGTGTSLVVAGVDDAEAVGYFARRVFDVSTGGGLDVSRLRLTGGIEWEGGAIFSDGGTVRLEKCEIDSNIASTDHGGVGGGAIWTTGGELTIVDCNFHDNLALRTEGPGEGGAIYATNTTLRVQGNSHFQSNSAREGGAIYCSGCIFHAVNSSFVGNEASAAEGSESDLDDSTGNWDSVVVGGAISLRDTSASVTDCLFEANTASGGGGALFGADDSTIAINDCTFRNNTTQGYGGAVAAGATVNFTDSKFEYNTAELGAGVSLADISSALRLG